MRIIIATEHENLLKHMLYDYHVSGPVTVQLCHRHQCSMGYEFNINDPELSNLMNVLDVLSTDGYIFEMICFGISQ